MSAQLTRARDAFDRREWAEARDAFSEIASTAALDPDDLERFADALWWAGENDAAIDTLERAYYGYVDQGDPERAVHVASFLTYLAQRRNATSVASGWLARAEHLLEGRPESYAHAWVAFMKAALGLFSGRGVEEVARWLEEALTLAERHNVPSVHALALGFKGFRLVTVGQWKEGMALVDEATAEALSSGVGDREACDVYCNTIAACVVMADYRRANEWTDEAERWMASRSLGGYPGICRVHRAEFKRARGEYAAAEQQARSACEELQRYRILDGVGYAFHEIALVKLRQGDLEAAEQALEKAYEFGHHSQPGLSLVMAARGSTEQAERALASVFGEWQREDGTFKSRIHLAELLSAYVPIALAAESEGAREATEELERIADSYDQGALRGRALAARGALELARGEPVAAAEALDAAWREFQTVDMPYEAAQARVDLARARSASGDETTARLELRAAHAVFQKLGARLDLRRTDELLGDDQASIPGVERRQMTFMFTDIVTSTDLISLIGDAAWADLLRWHDRAVRAEFEKTGGREVKHTGDGFFVAFENARDGVEAAVAIQRRLASHRSEHGFAPWIRIGLHTAEANVDGTDFSGQGVHVASRVADTAGQEEILVTDDVIESAGHLAYPVSAPRDVELKGVAQAVAVRDIEWR